MKRVVIIGAGGHGKVVADIVKRCGDEVMGFLDDKRPDELPQYKLIGTTKDIGTFGDVWYFPAIGDASIRENFVEQNTEVNWYTAIHPTAVIAEDVEVGHCTCVMANAVVNPGAQIGVGCILNTAATVDHDCVISDFVHLSPGAHVAGAVTVGKKTWIGVGASVVNNVCICESSMIGAGAVVVQDITKPGTYIGVPAKVFEG